VVLSIQNINLKPPLPNKIFNKNEFLLLKYFQVAEKQQKNICHLKNQVVSSKIKYVVQQNKNIQG